MNTPSTKKDTLVDQYGDIPVPDPYRWLENQADPEVQAWIQEQNKYTDSMLKNSAYEVFSDELVKNFKVVGFSNPIPVRGWYFYTERQPDQDQAVLYVKEGLDGVPKALVNPNGVRKDNAITISYWYVSKSGRYVAYGLSEGGTEMSTLYIKDIATNKNILESIPNCRHSLAKWLPDDSGFFYTRNPRPGSVPQNEEHLHTKVYLHILGTDPDTDVCIFGKDRPKDDMISLSLSMDGRYLAIHASQKWTENEVYVYDYKDKTIVLTVTKIPAKFRVIFLKDKVLISTNYNANNGRILWSSLSELYKPIQEWKEFISEARCTIESISVTKSKILVEYLKNACSEILIFDHAGEKIGTIPLPPYSASGGISCNREEEEFFYSVTSFTFPKITYHYDPRSKEFSTYRKTDNAINPDDYVIQQEWYVSKDSTRIPMFIFHKKGLKLEGKNPTLLYGYGGFGNSEMPAFMRNWVPWLLRGGIFAIANIRGGGEFGETWHKQGIKEHKQNSFDDFIAAAEYLIAKKYTNNEHLGITGGSNGGLLVSAVAVQRPDLFKAVCSRVPLTDMVRFPKFGMAIRWVHEYGNPENQERITEYPYMEPVPQC